MLSSNREQSEATLARLTAAARRDISALETSATLSTFQLTEIVAEAQQTLAEIQALDAAVTAQVAGLQLLITQLETQIAAIQGQIAGLGTAPPAPTLSLVGPPALHAAIVRITAPAGAAQSFVAEFKASTADPECAYVPVAYLPSTAFADGYCDVLVLSDRQATGTLRCYALRLGVPSVPATLSLAFTGSLADPDTLYHEETLTHVHVSWDAAEDARVLGYEVRADVKPTDAETSYANAVVVYQGRGLSFVYPIVYADRESRFRFWVSSRPRS